MKIAITSTGNSFDSNIDGRFGRCAYFVIYDTETRSTEFIPNPNKDNIENAGPNSAKLLSAKNVEKIVSGEFGLKVKSVFDSLHIQLIIVNDTRKSVGNIIELIANNK